MTARDLVRPSMMLRHSMRQVHGHHFLFFLYCALVAIRPTDPTTLLFDSCNEKNNDQIAPNNNERPMDDGIVCVTKLALLPRF